MPSHFSRFSSFSSPSGNPVDEGKRTDILVELHGKIQIYHTFDTFKDALRVVQCERYIPVQLKKGNLRFDN